MEENKIHSLQIKTDWDVWNSTWVTNKAYRLSEKYKVEIEIKVKPKSVELLINFGVAVVSGVISNLIYEELKKYLRKKKQKSEKMKRPLPLAVLIKNGKKEII